ncbi:MAG: hypothetical protein ACPGPS_19755 [Rubripirellula sp.]
MNPIAALEECLQASAFILAWPCVLALYFGSVLWLCTLALYFGLCTYFGFWNACELT